MIYIDLPNDKPLNDIQTVSFEIFLPTKEDCDMLKRDFIALISRVLVKYLPQLKEFADALPQHIPHEMSAVMSKKSDIVGIL